MYTEILIKKKEKGVTFIPTTSASAQGKLKSTGSKKRFQDDESILRWQFFFLLLFWLLLLVKVSIIEVAGNTHHTISQTHTERITYTHTHREKKGGNWVFRKMLSNGEKTKNLIWNFNKNSDFGLYNSSQGGNDFCWFKNMSPAGPKKLSFNTHTHTKEKKMLTYWHLFTNGKNSKRKDQEITEKELKKKRSVWMLLYEKRKMCGHLLKKRVWFSWQFWEQPDENLEFLFWKSDRFFLRGKKIFFLNFLFISGDGDDIQVRICCRQVPMTQIPPTVANFAGRWAKLR
jgi:hypothetical protein